MIRGALIALGFGLCTGVARANDSLDKKMLLLNRALKHDDCKQAIEVTAKLVNEFPQDGRVWILRGQSLDCDGRSAEAYEAYLRALALGLETPEMRTAMEKIAGQLALVQIDVERQDLSDEVFDALAGRIDLSITSESGSNQTLSLAIGKSKVVPLLPDTHELKLNLDVPELIGWSQSITTDAGSTPSVQVTLAQTRPVRLKVPKIDPGLVVRARYADAEWITLQSESTLETNTGPIELDYQIASSDRIAQNLTIEKHMDMLPLAWGYEIKIEDTTVALDLAKPHTTHIEQKIEVFDPVRKAEKIPMTVSLEGQPGQLRQFMLQSEDIPVIQTHRQLVQARNKNTSLNRARFGAVGVGTALSLVAGLRFQQGEQQAQAAQAIDDANDLSEYEDAVNTGTAYRKQGRTLIAAGGGLISVGLAVKLGPSRKADARLRTAEAAFAAAQKEPIQLLTAEPSPKEEK